MTHAQSIDRPRWSSSRWLASAIVSLASLIGMAVQSVIAAESAIESAIESAVEIDGLAGTFQPVATSTNGLAALIIAGSGPTDRNGNNTFGLRTDAYRLIAQDLEKAGIASLRYDKRGVAGSTARVTSEESLTVDQFVDDVVKVANWLREQKGVRDVLLIGHSEGGVIALLAADRVKPKALVLLATPGRPLAALLREQMNQVAVPDPIRVKALPIIASLERGEKVDAVPDELMGLFRPSVQGFLLSLMKVDPAAVLAATPVRALVIGGSKDVQVTRGDFDALLRARPKADSLWLTDMTHALKQLPNGALQQRTYTDPTLPLAGNLMKTVTDFLLK